MNIEIQTLLHKIKQFRLSTLEIVSLSGVLILASIVFFFYMARIEPLTSQISELDSQEIQLQAKLLKWSTEERKRSEQSENAEKILSSLDQFNDVLKPQDKGRYQIIDELDALGKIHKIFVGDTVYRENAGDGSSQNGIAGSSIKKEKLQDAFPSFGIDTTVIGDYRSLRKFLVDLESSKQFLVIKSLSFQGEERRGGGPPDDIRQPANPGSIPVSLKIEMNTFFRKTRL